MDKLLQTYPPINVSKLPVAVWIDLRDNCCTAGYAVLWMPHFWKMGSAETNLKQEMILPISTGYTEIVEYLPYFLLISLPLKSKWNDSISMVSMSYCQCCSFFLHSII